MNYCPECGKEVKALESYPSTLFYCETCKKTYEENSVGFTAKGWKILGRG